MRGPAAHLTPRPRPFTAAERRLLRARARELRRRGSADLKVVGVAVAVVACLWAATLLASDAPWPVVTGFWIVAGTVIALWARHDAASAARYARMMAAELEAAAEHGRAEVTDVAARRYAELEEFEDEGACWAFELYDGRLVFVVGQDFYREARFPSLEFSLVHAVDTQGRTVDRWIEKRGPSAPPDRVVPRDVKARIEDLPEHLEVRGGPLERLEESLGIRR